jgi:O-antigen/teichoic acid export membrane protein
MLLKYPANGWTTSFVNRLGRKFIQDVTVLTTANIVGAGLSFLQGMLAAIWLGPEQYGVAALTMSCPGIIYTLFDARSSEALVRYISKYHVGAERGRALAVCKLGYTVDVAMALAAFFFISITAKWSAQHIIHHPETAGMVIAYGAAFIPQALTGASNAVLTSLGRFPAIAWLSTATAILRTSLVLGLVLNGWGASGVVLGNAIATAVNGLLYGCVAWSVCRRTWSALPIRADLRALDGQFREIFSFLACSDLNSLVGILPRQMDLVILGYLQGPEQAGWYKLAKRLAGAVHYVAAPLQSVIYPELSRRHDLGGVKSVRERAGQLLIRIGIPVGFGALGGALLLPCLLPHIFGVAYQPSIVAAQLLFLGSAAGAALFWLRPAYFALGRIKAWTVITVAAAVLSALGFLVITPVCGHKGMAGWSASMVLLSSGSAVAYIRRAWR